MSKLEFSKEHFIPRTTLKTNWPTKEAIFSTDKTNCKRKRMHTSNFNIKVVLIKLFKNTRSNNILISNNIKKKQ